MDVSEPDTFHQCFASRLLLLKRIVRMANLQCGRWGIKTIVLVRIKRKSNCTCAYVREIQLNSLLPTQCYDLVKGWRETWGWKSAPCYQRYCTLASGEEDCAWLCFLKKSIGRWSRIWLFLSAQRISLFVLVALPPCLFLVVIPLLFRRRTSKSKIMSFPVEPVRTVAKTLLSVEEQGPLKRQTNSFAPVVGGPSVVPNVKMGHATQQNASCWQKPRSDLLGWPSPISSSILSSQFWGCCYSSRSQEVTGQRLANWWIMLKTWNLSLEGRRQQQGWRNSYTISLASLGSPQTTSDTALVCWRQTQSGWGAMERPRPSTPTSPSSPTLVSQTWSYLAILGRR